MKRDNLRHKTIITLEKLPFGTTTTTSRSIDVQQNCIDEPLSCPDCFDTLIKFYDWDKIRYLCENCGLSIANNSAPFLASFIANE